MLGIQVTMNDINTQAGNIASWINEYYNQAVEMKQYFDRIGKPGLIALGFNDVEADTLISAFADLAYQKENSFDSSEFVKRLYGMGFK